MRTLPTSSAPLVARASLSPARMVVVCGDHAWTLGVHLAAQVACEYKKVLFLSGDNRFDPYLVARLVRSLDESQEEALSRILVARAFTAYQLDELIHRLNPEEAFGVVIVSGVCTAFYDEDITHSDAARLFYRSLRRLVALSGEGLALLFTQSETPKGAKRAYFLTDLCRASNVVMRLEDEHSFTLERRRDQLKLAK
ncbi:MAG: hypothetical protein AB7U82_25675 [Blastocatellales bacterium]